MLLIYPMPETLEIRRHKERVFYQLLEHFNAKRNSTHRNRQLFDGPLLIRLSFESAPDLAYQDYIMCSLFHALGLPNVPEDVDFRDDELWQNFLDFADIVLDHPFPPYPLML